MLTHLIVSDRKRFLCWLVFRLICIQIHILEQRIQNKPILKSKDP